jgi:hypothetical protein
MHFAHKPSAFVAFSRSGHFMHNLCQGINRGFSSSEFEVDYFYESMIRPPVALNALVENQRFFFNDQIVTQQQANDSNAMQQDQSMRTRSRWSNGTNGTKNKKYSGGHFSDMADAWLVA